MVNLFITSKNKVLNKYLFIWIFFFWQHVFMNQAQKGQNVYWSKLGHFDLMLN